MPVAPPPAGGHRLSTRGRLRTARRDARRGSPRAWLTLLVLGVVVVVLSLGPVNLIETVQDGLGLTYTRPPIASVEPPASYMDTDLQRRLEAAATLPSGTIGAVIVDLDHGAQADVNGRRQFPAASLFKVPILIEVLLQQHVHRLSPESLLEVGPEDWTDGSGVLQARVGERLPVRELVRLMIQESDNIAALVLLDAVGAKNVNATLGQLGLEQTHVVDRRAGETGAHTTSARDMAHLLTLIGSGQLVDEQVSEQALKALELEQAHTWLAESLPWWVTVAHKWGDLPGARHDAGIVFAPRARFVTVVLTEGAPPDAAERAIRETARAAFRYLGEQH